MILTRLWDQPRLLVAASKSAAHAAWLLIPGLACMIGLSSAPGMAQAITFYDNAANRLPNRYNPQDSDRIVFDDVPIPRSLLELNGQLPAAILLESITYGVRRTGLASSVRVTAYAAGFAPDFLASSTPIAPASLQLLDEQILPEVIVGGPLTQPVTFAFLPQFARRIPLTYRGDYGYFAAGLAFENSGPGNAWNLVASSSVPAPPSGCEPGGGGGAVNEGCFWEIGRLGGPQTTYNGFDTGAGDIAASFSLQVQGRPDFSVAAVPAPAPLPVLGLWAAARTARRLARVRRRPGS